VYTPECHTGEWRYRSTHS